MKSLKLSASALAIQVALFSYATSLHASRSLEERLRSNGYSRHTATKMVGEPENLVEIVKEVHKKGHAIIEETLDPSAARGNFLNGMNGHNFPLTGTPIDQNHLKTQFAAGMLQDVHDEHGVVFSEKALERCLFAREAEIDKPTPNQLKAIRRLLARRVAEPDEFQKPIVAQIEAADVIHQANAARPVGYPAIEYTQKNVDIVVKATFNNFMHPFAYVDLTYANINAAIRRG